MSLLKFFSCIIFKCLCTLCPPIYRLFSKCNRRQNLRVTSFAGGFALGQAYYNYLLKKIPFPYYIGPSISLILSALLGIGNAISTQIRCISLLMFPMYCGKAGRGVLKAVILTYVVAGPITNMGLNAKEVVRVFACSTQLAYNLSKERYAIIAKPLRNTALGLTSELDQVKDALRSVSDISAPIECEIENEEEIEQKRKENDYLDDTLTGARRSDYIEAKFKSQSLDDKQAAYQQTFEKKFEYRCEHQLSEAVGTCARAFSTAYQSCYDAMPGYASWMLCWPLKLNNVCGFINDIRGVDGCDSRRQLDPGLGKGYAALKNAEQQLTADKELKLQYKVYYERDLVDIQDAKETGERVMNAFDEKTKIMQAVLVALNVCMACLFLRIVVAAVTYHDMYLTGIGYDNVYITGYFKELDGRRRKKGKFTLLPLKKVERMKYVDVQSINYKAPERSKLVTQMLKVMLEVVTATTFVMLDRLFFEALDVVRQYAETEVTQGARRVNIEVEGTGMLATLLRKLLDGLNSRPPAHRVVTNRECLPKPRAMPPVFFIKIYGGYVWILMLLYINPYTLRLRRLICSYFYPRREKQRILHLYNDILKKRMKMMKTLRRNAVQAVRAHYLSAENLLSLRMKFPQVLGWLQVLPAARMTCLICGETQPRTETNEVLTESRWHPCHVSKCPFVYCGECWREAGARCLACDPSLAELSDVDSLSDDEYPAYG